MARGSVQKFQGKRGISYRVAIDVGKHPDGSRHQIRRSFRTRKEADRFLAQTIESLRTRAWAEPSPEPLGAYLARWVDAAALRGVKPSSQAKYDDHRIHRWGPLAAVRLRDLTPARIEARMAEELAAGRAPATVRSGLVFLRAALQDAVERGELPSNPAARVAAPRVPRTPVVAWTADEADKVLAAVRADPRWAWHEALVYVLLETGLRIGEALALSWSDVDLAGAALSVARTQTTTRDGARTVDAAKTDESRRTVRLSAPAVAVLRAHRARLLEVRLREGPGWNGGDLVFPSRRGGEQHRNRVADLLVAASEKAGVRPLTSHGLRHSSATEAIRRGVPAKVLSERLGHKQVAFTMQVYVHPDRDDHAEAAAALGEAFGRGQKEGA